MSVLVIVHRCVQAVGGLTCSSPYSPLCSAPENKPRRHQLAHLLSTGAGKGTHSCNRYSHIPSHTSMGRQSEGAAAQGIQCRLPAPSPDSDFAPPRLGWQILKFRNFATTTVFVPKYLKTGLEMVG
eukprot:2040550-Rhodomonas_salina.3